MFTKDSQSGAGNNLIRLSDYYPGNCSEQKTEIINDEVLAALKEFKRADENYRVWTRRHRAGTLYFDDEEYMGNLGLYTGSHTAGVETAVWLEQVLTHCGKPVIRRAKLYFIEGLTVRTIAEMESVHYTSVCASIEKAKAVLYRVLKKERE